MKYRQVSIIGGGGTIKGSFSELDITVNPSWQEAEEEGKCVSGHYRQLLKLTVILPIDQAAVRIRKEFTRSVVEKEITIKTKGLRFVGYSEEARWNEKYDDDGATYAVEIELTVFGEEN